MLTVYDIQLPKGENCGFCLGKAVVNLAGADLCAGHADQEWPAWREYLPREPKKAPAGFGRTKDSQELGM